MGGIVPFHLQYKIASIVHDLSLYPLPRPNHIYGEYVALNGQPFKHHPGGNISLTDGEIPTDDSVSERALRNFTIGRKN